MTDRKRRKRPSRYAVIRHLRWKTPAERRRAIQIAAAGERRLARRLEELDRNLPSTDQEFLGVQLTI